MSTSVEGEIEAEYVKYSHWLGIGRDAALKRLRAADDPQAELGKLKRRHKRVAGKLFGPHSEKRQREREEHSRREIERQREHWRQQQEQEAEERANLTLGQRLDAVVRNFELLALVRAAAPASSLAPSIGHSKPESRAPRLVGIDDESMGEVYARRLALLVEAAERALDAEKGRVLGTAVESGEEKDARILSDWQGMTPEEVSFLDPSLGTPGYIGRLREINGLRPRDGRPRKEAA